MALDAAAATDLRACAVLGVEGRQYPIEVFYEEKPVANYLQATVDTAIALHDAERRPAGDVLAFLPGAAEVDWVVTKLQDEAARREEDEKAARLRVLPLYAHLPFSEQIKAFQRAPRNTRKIVVATNIAEASITLPNILYGKFSSPTGVVLQSPVK